MRSSQLVLLATLVLGSREAAAEPLELAGGTLTLGIGTLTLLTLPVASASVMVSSTGGFTLPAGLAVETGATLPSSLFTGVSGLSGIRVTDLSNGPLSFDGESGFGVGPLAGRMLVNVLQISSLTLPLSVVGSPGASHHTSGFVVDFFG